MAIEIEKKYRLTADERRRVLRSLEKADAVFEREDFEENNIYSSRELKANRAVLRLRKTQDKVVLTYKRKIEQSAAALKHQIEHETIVADAEAARNIIESLGFEKAVVYEKRRQTWTLGRSEIVLDELPFGFYMEIEGDGDEIAEAERILKLESLESEPETYPQLAEKFGKKNGRVAEARFA